MGQNRGKYKGEGTFMILLHMDHLKKLQCKFDKITF